MSTIMLVNKSFYPDPVVGSVRVTNWARMLDARGDRVIAVARHFDATASPATIASQIGPGVEAHYLLASGRRIENPTDTSRPAGGDIANGSGLQTKLRKAVVSAMVPDSSVVFWKRALPVIRGIARSERVDVVVTSSPLASVHDVGRALKRELGIGWIADYRDPHLLDERFAGGKGPVQCVLRGLQHRHEARVYAEADAVTHAVPLHHRWAVRRYSEAGGRCVFLPHPTPTDLASGEIEPILAPGGRVSVRTVGAIDGIDALRLARQVRSLVDEGRDLDLTLVGPTPSTESEIRDLLGDRAAIVGRVRHDIAKSYIAGAGVLVSFLSEQRSGSAGISSKLYEFLAAGAPVVHINPARSDSFVSRWAGPLMEVLRRPSDTEIRSALARALDRADSSVLHRRREAFLDMFRWETHAKTLAAVVDRVATKADERGANG